MPHYLTAIYFPDDYDPSAVTAEAAEEIHALNRELIAAGVSPPGRCTVLTME